MTGSPRGQLTRRSFISGVGAVLLGGCASAPDPARAAATASPKPPTPSPVVTTPSPVETTPSPVAPSPSPALPDRETIVARFRDRRPTQWGLSPTGVVTRTSSPHVALTLDACGGPNGSGVDAELLDFLRAEGIPATLFVNKRWIEANRGVFDQLAGERDLFDLGNHGTRHRPLSVSGASAYGLHGTADVGEVYDEVAENHLFMTELLGTPPLFFRSGTAHYDEVAVEVVLALGETPIGFDVNGDAGASFSRDQVVSATSAATPGSIIIGHFNQPTGASFEGFATALPRLRDAGISFARLSDVA